MLILAVICFCIFRVFQASYSGAVNFYAYLNAAYSDYREKQAAEKETKIKIPAQFKDFDTILFIGVNKSNYTVNADADALILLNVNQYDGALSALLIPRNTLVTMGNSISSVSSFQNYGSEKTLEAVSSLLDKKIDKYVIVDENALASLVDTFGGIDLYAGSDMNYDDPEGGVSIHLNKGYQHFDGNKALQYLMYRSDDLGDLGRVERQEAFIRSFYQQIFNFKAVFYAPDIVNIINNSLYTNVDFFTFTNLKNYIRIAGKNSLTVKTLPGRFSPDGSSWQPDAVLIHDLLQEMFNFSN